MDPTLSHSVIYVKTFVSRSKVIIGSLRLQNRFLADKVLQPPMTMCSVLKSQLHHNTNNRTSLVLGI